MLAKQKSHKQRSQIPSEMLQRIQEGFDEWPGGIRSPFRDYHKPNSDDGDTRPEVEYISFDMINEITNNFLDIVQAIRRTTDSSQEHIVLESLYYFEVDRKIWVSRAVFACQRAQVDLL